MLLMRRLVFLSALLSFAWRGYCGLLLHQIGENPLLTPFNDYTYWAFIASGAVRFLTMPPMAAIFDTLWLGIIIWGLLSQNNRFAPLLYTLFAFTYQVVFGSLAGAHNGFFNGFLFIAIPFIATRSSTRILLWEGLRYYTVWLYFSSFLWKLAHQFLFSFEEGRATILATNAPYIAQHPHSLLSLSLQYLIAHPNLSFGLLAAGALSQGFFIVGFFTKKLDNWLFIFPFFFHFAAYLLFDVCFAELLVLQLTFIRFISK
jgi:hypothetical protein